MGVGTSASWKIFLAPDLVEYRCYFWGYPLIMGISNFMASLKQSVETKPGTMYAYLLPLIMLLSLLSILGE